MNNMIVDICLDINLMVNKLNYIKSGSFTFSVYSQDTNFWGAVHGTLYAIPHLKNSKGRIIVVASGCGWFPLPRLSIYNVNIDISSFQFYFNLLFNLFMSQNNSLTLWYQASKAATISFFETLRIELGWSIGITIVTPGFIKTNMALKAYEEEVGQLVPCIILHLL